MCIYCDYCVYHYKSTELVSLYTLDIGLQINIIIIKNIQSQMLQRQQTQNLLMQNIINQIWPPLPSQKTLSCVSVKLSYMMESRIVKSKFPIFQLQEVTVTQGFVVEYVCMSETQ